MQKSKNLMTVINCADRTGKEGSVVTILKVLDRIEGLIRKSPRIPLTGMAVIDAEKVLALLERVRADLPEEVKQAIWVSKENQRILQDAQTNAEKVVADAREEAGRLTSDHEVLAGAREHADLVIRNAQEEAVMLRQGAEEYVRGIMGGIENELSRILSVVARAKERLNGSSDSSADGRSSFSAATAPESRRQSGAQSSERGQLAEAQQGQAQQQDRRPPDRQASSSPLSSGQWADAGSSNRPPVSGPADGSLSPTGSGSGPVYSSGVSRHPDGTGSTSLEQAVVE